LKLNQVVVKEFRESGGQAAIIAVNLAAGSAEEADILAFNLITAALTMAQENIPTALAAYDDRKIIASGGSTKPAETIRQALGLIKEIKIVHFTGRYLDPVNIDRIQRNIQLLQRVETEPAQRLRDIFIFEQKALEESAAKNPASVAIMSAARQVPGPATILLVSRLNHDAEAVTVTCGRLGRMNYTTIHVAGAAKILNPRQAILDVA
jgi:hypothetical protein